MDMYLQQKYLLLLSSQLGQFKKKSNNLFNFRCPYCGDSQKHKNKARGYIFEKTNTLIIKVYGLENKLAAETFAHYTMSLLQFDYNATGYSMPSTMIH